MSEEEINKMIEVYDEVIADLKQENSQLKERIEKAIEYATIYRSYENIDGKDYLKSKNEIGELSLSQVDKLLKILKGDKE